MKRWATVHHIDRYKRSEKLARLCNPSKTVTDLELYKDRRKCFFDPKESLKVTSFDFEYYINILANWKGGESNQETATTNEEGTDPHR